MFDAIKRNKDLLQALERGKKLIGTQIESQQQNMQNIEAPGLFDEKAKLLMSLAVICYVRCEECVALHMPKIVEAGATKEEVMEAGACAISFGGGPSMAFLNLIVSPSYDQFKKKLSTARKGKKPTKKALFG